MANYYAYARSNYFHVKDKDVFDKFCQSYDLEKIEDAEGRVGFISNNEDGMPTVRIDEKTQEYLDAEPMDEIAPMLKPGEAAIVMQIGWEKMRYLTGCATAIDSNGESIRSDISDIYDKAKDTFKVKDVTLCEY